MTIEQQEVICILRMMLKRMATLEESDRLLSGVFSHDEHVLRSSVIDSIIKELACKYFSDESWISVLTVVRQSTMENVKKCQS